MNQPEYIIEPTTDELALQLAKDVALMLQLGISERGKASLVVSGGSTPIPFFSALKDETLDWGKVSVTLADERWVPTDHSDSNERLVRENLLTGNAAQAQFISLYVDGLSAEDAVDFSEKRLKEIGQPFDVVVLGMGDDGHTASLFPDATGLMDAVDLHLVKLCRAMKPPVAPHHRMTLTLSALTTTKNLLLHITGANKRQVLEYALIDGSINRAPVSALFLQDRLPVKVYWADNN